MSRQPRRNPGRVLCYTSSPQSRAVCRTMAGTAMQTSTRTALPTPIIVKHMGLRLWPPSISLTRYFSRSLTAHAFPENALQTILGMHQHGHLILLPCLQAMHGCKDRSILEGLQTNPCSA